MDFITVLTAVSFFIVVMAAIAAIGRAKDAERALSHWRGYADDIEAELTDAENIISFLRQENAAYEDVERGFAKAKSRLLASRDYWMDKFEKLRTTYWSIESTVRVMQEGAVAAGIAADNRGREISILKDIIAALGYECTYTERAAEDGEEVDATHVDIRLVKIDTDKTKKVKVKRGKTAPNADAA